MVLTEGSTSLSAIFTQLSHITKLRDALVHRGWDHDDMGFVSATLITAKTLENVEILKLNHDDLMHAFSDLGHIILRLCYAFDPCPHLNEKEVRKPWRYKPRPLEWPN